MALLKNLRGKQTNYKTVEKICNSYCSSFLSLSNGWNIAKDEA